jgi:hypothetical protein
MRLMTGGINNIQAAHDKSFGCQTKAFAMALKALQPTLPSGTPRVGGGATVGL